MKEQGLAACITRGLRTATRTRPQTSRPWRPALSHIMEKYNIVDGSMGRTCGKIKDEQINKATSRTMSKRAQQSSREEGYPQHTCPGGPKCTELSPQQTCPAHQPDRLKPKRHPLEPARLPRQGHPPQAKPPPTLPLVVQPEFMMRQPRKMIYPWPLVNTSANTRLPHLKNNADSAEILATRRAIGNPRRLHTYCRITARRPKPGAKHG